MYKSLCLTLLIALFIGCASEEGGNTNRNETASITGASDVSFAEYLKSLDPIDLPLTHSTLGKLEDASINYNKSGFQKYSNASTTHPLGILYQTDAIVVLFECIPADLGIAPIITTFTLEGTKIDSLSAFSKSGFDMAYEATEQVQFTKDFNIIVTDSVKKWDLNVDGTDVIKGSMKLTTDTTIYQIQPNGKIKTSPIN